MLEGDEQIRSGQKKIPIEFGDFKAAKTADFEQ